MFKGNRVSIILGACFTLNAHSEPAHKVNQGRNEAKGAVKSAPLSKVFTQDQELTEDGPDTWDYLDLSDAENAKLNKLTKDYLPIGAVPTLDQITKDNRNLFEEASKGNKAAKAQMLEYMTKDELAEKMKNIKIEKAALGDSAYKDLANRCEKAESAIGKHECLDSYAKYFNEWSKSDANKGKIKVEGGLRTDSNKLNALEDLAFFFETNKVAYSQFMKENQAEQDAEWGAELIKNERRRVEVAKGKK